MPSPLATNATRCAWLRTGNVSVMRVLGGLGESVRYATQPSCSSRSSWPGKSEHVCPSGLQRQSYSQHRSFYLIGREAVGCSPDSEQDQVEPRERDRVRADKGRDHLLLVLVRDLLRVVELTDIDRVDVLARDRNL